jgi:hypothetical protein
MTTRPDAWRTLDLELFRDGELPEPARGAIGEALREDPALRQRLAAAARIDTLARQAMIEGPVCAAQPGGRWRLFGAAIACAAVLALGVTVAMRIGPPAAPSVPPARVVAEVVPEASSYRIVWSIPVVAAQRPVPAISPDTNPKPDAEQLERALASDDERGAAKVLAEASIETRAAAYRRMGELIRSAGACERLLDSMEPSEQLSVCRQWAMDPRLRPVTFARLAKLGGNSTLSVQYAGVVGALSEYPELRPWLRSYIAAPLPGAVPGGRG